MQGRRFGGLGEGAQGGLWTLHGRHVELPLVFKAFSEVAGP